MTLILICLYPIGRYISHVAKPNVSNNFCTTNYFLKEEFRNGLRISVVVLIQYTCTM